MASDFDRGHFHHAIFKQVRLNSAIGIERSFIADARENRIR
jgi:hypothetical protein